MNDYTKGPWGIMKGDHGLMIFSGECGRVVAMLARQVTTAEREANARLIAAAPELLEALRQCAEVLEHTAGSATGYCCCGDRMDTHADPMSSGHIPVDEGLYHAQRVADVARAAIAKAKGETK